MRNLSNTQIAWITAGAALVSALLTGTLIFMIEVYKSRSSFEENQRGAISLLANDIQVSTVGLEDLYLRMKKDNGQQNDRILEEMLRQMKLYLDNVDNSVMLVILREFKYLPNKLQKKFILYYRTTKEFRKLIEYILLNDHVRKPGELLPQATVLVLHLLLQCHKILAEIAHHNMNAVAEIAHRKEIKRYISLVAKTRKAWGEKKPLLRNGG